MIRVINQTEFAKYADDLREMYRIRARVFHDRLQWKVVVTDGLEIDQFDTECNPLYALSIGSGGEIEGCFRLLTTTGPNMLRDVFPELLPDGLVVESNTIWESTRFCLNPDLPATPGRHLNRVTLELLCALIEIGTDAGLSNIVTVYDARMARVLRAAKFPIEVIGGPVKIGEVQTYAGLIECGEQARRAFAFANSIVGSVLEHRHPTASAA